MLNKLTRAVKALLAIPGVKVALVAIATKAMTKKDKAEDAKS